MDTRSLAQVGKVFLATVIIALMACKGSAQTLKDSNPSTESDSQSSQANEEGWIDLFNGKILTAGRSRLQAIRWERTMPIRFVLKMEF